MAAKLNYRPNRIASSLRSGKSHVIGVIIPSAKINFFGSVVHGIESIANMHGYNVLIYQSEESHEHEANGIDTFLSARVDGILLSLAKDTYDYNHFKEVTSKNIPLVLFDRTANDNSFPAVVIDDFKGAYMATEHLIQQGYRRIAHVSGPTHLKIFDDRIKGYMAALRDNKIKVNKSLIYTGDVSIEAGRQAVGHFMKQSTKPDAFFAVEDFTALGVIKALKERDCRIPEDFGVVGFANENFGEHITPTLSTIDQQTVLMGREAIKLLLQLCENPSGKQDIQSRIVLEPLPVFRESSKRSNS